MILYEYEVHPAVTERDIPVFLADMRANNLIDD
jgi:hypothetical protein